ncbi:plasmid replication protein RepC [Palleronia caenipelagi]|uniref:Replication initiation protein RepC n=1 Tax=Palleronia caenipelagi TaxID=2489174 RepID=A0A547PML9_9RHOB|nr:plasmid replication protein RepC [Palleronia caenipelagi]TRD15376.1 replication initiation protein RepC [Palleronia caenipelagi]
MTPLTTTPFGPRPVTAGLLAQEGAQDTAPAVPHMDKWSLFHDLCTARAAFGISDRDLTVLNALLSFHPSRQLSDNDLLIVFPSNKALSARAHGMAESSLRRHLAALVAAGLIRRHDSPNGKRYARKGPDGDLSRAFGFDLRPLLLRSEAIAHAAAEAEAATERLRRTREEASLMKRDALKLALYGLEEGLSGDWDSILDDLRDIHRAMRRRLDVEDLEQISCRLSEILRGIRQSFDVETEQMSGNDLKIERQYQNSKTKHPDLEPCPEPGTGGAGPQNGSEAALAEPERRSLPLYLVLKACPDILPYADGPPRSWHEFTAAAGFVRGMMGISASAWEEACRDMGSDVAAITVACILQRFDQINSPGGYLRALSRKAAEGAFSPGPMVMALLNGAGRV